MEVGYRITEQRRVQGRLSSNPPSRMGRQRLRGSSVLLLKAIPGKQHDQILRGGFQKLVRRNKACGMLPCGFEISQTDCRAPASGLGSQSQAYWGGWDRIVKLQ
jgi:hypothetical protein